MVNSILESKLKCNNYYSEQEELYKKYMKDRYGVSIQMICFSKGYGQQRFLHLWINEDENAWMQDRYAAPESQKTLILKSGKILTEQEIVEGFVQCFSYNDRLADIFLFIYEFRTSLIRYSYRQALKGMRAYFSATYGLESRYLLGTTGYPEFIFDLFTKELPVVLKDRETLEKKCYEFLKEYDDYDVITPEDVHLRFFDHEELTKAGLGYLRWIYR